VPYLLQTFSWMDLWRTSAEGKKFKTFPWQTHAGQFLVAHAHLSARALGQVRTRAGLERALYLLPTEAFAIDWSLTAEYHDLGGLGFVDLIHIKIDSFPRSQKNMFNA
jgi:hypothetical protein